MSGRNLVALVLAAGLAQRFGGDKLLHDLDGQPLAAHVADTLAAMAFAHRLAICPTGNAGRSAVFAARGFEVIENAEPERGMGASLALGAARALALGADAMLVCLADMPFVTAAHLRALLASDSDVVATEVDGVRGPPAVFARGVLPELLTLTGDQGARHLIRSAAVVAAAPDLVRDFDLRSDFGQAR